MWSLNVTKHRTETYEVLAFVTKMRQDQSQRARMIDYIATHAPARSKDLAGIGVAATALSRAVAEGSVLRIGRGLYQLPASEPDLHSALIEVAKRAPKAVICLTSALSFHQLTDQLPRKVWIAIGAKDWAPKITYPQIRVVRFREPYLTNGLELHRIGSVDLRVHSVAKTIADAFRNPKLVDRSVAIEAMKSALNDRKATPGQLAAAAKENAAWNQMRPYLEALTSNG
jgi:predicted transcriptional regulator of viral defense system